jgi:hypothetical protein
MNLFSVPAIRSSFGVAVFAYKPAFFSKPGGGHLSGFFVGKFFFFLATGFFFVTGFLSTLALLAPGLGVGLDVAALACTGISNVIEIRIEISFFIYQTT